MTNTAHIKDVDKQIAQLMQCKALSEQEIKELCEKVSPSFCLDSKVDRKRLQIHSERYTFQQISNFEREMYIFDC
jgi:hypothetical protein